MQRAGTGQDADLRSCFKHISEPAQVGVARLPGCFEIHRCGLRRAGRRHVAVRILVGWSHLQVVRERDVADGATRERMPHGEIDKGGDVQRVGHHDVVLGDVLVQLLQVHFLLVARAEQARLLHAGDGQNRLMVKLGVVEAVQQMHATRA